jgi:HD-GYP domain-containing protein (c-di-GMP phosphodiesterase class II)
MAPDYRGDFLTCHCLNVAFLSCRMGVGMSLPYKDITELVVGALLHDFGMTRVPTDVTSHAGALSKEQKQAMEEHPIHAWRYFEKLRREFPWLLCAVLQEHKREHGQGYPATTTESEELHLYARIIGVCDSLEALTHTRPFRKAFHPADAMKTIIEAREFLFSRNLLRGAINSLSMYPVGSLVRLNSNCTAQVVESVTDAPLRPVVRVLSETDDGAPEERVDLSRDSNLYVTGLVYTEKYIVPENRKPGQA